MEWLLGLWFERGGANTHTTTPHSRTPIGLLLELIYIPFMFVKGQATGQAGPCVSIDVWAGGKPRPRQEVGMEDDGGRGGVKLEGARGRIRGILLCPSMCRLNLEENPRGPGTPLTCRLPADAVYVILTDVSSRSPRGSNMKSARSRKRSRAPSIAAHDHDSMRER